MELVIQEACALGYTLVSKIKNTKMALKYRNKKSFSNVQSRIGELKKEIQENQAGIPGDDLINSEQSK